MNHASLEAIALLWQKAALVGLVAATSFALGAGALALAEAVLRGETAMPVWTEEGDVITAHVRAYDATGILLGSTRAADKSVMEDAKRIFPGPYVVAAVEKPINLRLVNLTQPHLIDWSSSYTLGESFLGKTVGYTQRVPVHGQRQGFNLSENLAILRGPFPITYWISSDKLENHLAGDGKTAVLDDVLSAEVIGRNETKTLVRVDVQDGQRLHVGQAEIDAVVVLADDAKHFSLRLETAVGHQFSILSPCYFGDYVLTAGTYRVTSVNETTIGFAKSPTQLPQLLDREVLHEIQIIAINKGTSLGGDHE